MTVSEDWAAAMADLARELQAEPDETHTMERLVKAAVDVVYGCTAASVTLRARRGRWHSAASTEEAVATADCRQYELDEGPCVTAATENRRIYAGNLATDDRWPRWSPDAVKLGFTSALAIPLFTDERVWGALNLYGSERHVFSPRAQDEAEALAAHAAVALADQRELDGLAIAVRNRTVIGQAQGILMERFGLDAKRAFALLCRISSCQNTKLTAVADDIVRTRHLPLTPGSASSDVSAPARPATQS